MSARFFYENGWKISGRNRQNHEKRRPPETDRYPGKNFRTAAVVCDRETNDRGIETFPAFAGKIGEIFLCRIDLAKLGKTT